MLELGGNPLSVEQVRSIYNGHVPIRISPECKEKILKSQNVIKKVLEDKKTVYGINTGFGHLANKKIADDDLCQLQKSLVLSHSAGVGDPLKENIVRMILVLKIHSLVQGFSGVSYDTVEYLMELYNKNILPVIPSQGSVGASGDLAPLAHMSAVLIGEGEATFNGKKISAKVALKQLNKEPLILGPKEGLALLNGTQVSLALCFSGLFEVENCFSAGLFSGSMSIEAACGSHKPLDKKIHEVRNQYGQIKVAEAMRKILAGSEIVESHENCEKVQDPYSLRCQPQVMGACLDQIDHVAKILQRESNAVTDNPLIFSEPDEIISGGNFHAEPVAFCADILAMVITEIGSLSERRVSLLVDSSLSQLPPFLVNNSGINSGFMIAHVTCAALVSENKSLSFPCSVDSIPTSANQEDHVSMATHGSRRLIQMNNNLANILAIEILASCQGLDFRLPLRSSSLLDNTKNYVRNEVKFYSEDRYFSSDVEKVQNIVKSGYFLTGLPSQMMPSQMY